MDYEVWETNRDDGCVARVALRARCLTLREAIQRAIDCGRPGIEVLCPARGGYKYPYWLSHVVDGKGRWTARNLRAAP